MYHKAIDFAYDDVIVVVINIGTDDMIGQMN